MLICKGKGTRIAKITLKRKSKLEDPHYLDPKTYSEATVIKTA